METYISDEVAIAGLWITLTVGEQEEVFAVNVEPVLWQRLTAYAVGICPEFYISLAWFLPGEGKEHDGEISTDFRYCLRFRYCIYASDGFHRRKTTSCITQVKGHVSAQKRATPKGCPVAMSPFMAGTVKEMEIKVCQLLFGSGEDESYFRKNFPCNARRKISGVGLVFREKSFSLPKFS